MIIIYKRPGRLANSIWLYAHLIAFSIEYNIPILFPAFIDYGEYFQSTSTNLLYRFPQKKSPFPLKKITALVLRSIPLFIRFCLKFKFLFVKHITLKPDEEFNLMEVNNIKILSANFVFIEGWQYRAESLVVKHKNKIIDFFEPQEKYKDNVNTLIKKCRAACEILIGVHIRREDYKTAFEGKYYYEMADYKKKMKEIEELMKDKKVGFLICSNEEINPKDFSDLNFFLANNHIIEDMYSLAKCDYIIGPPSTYSMWASYYGGKPLYQIKEITPQIKMDQFELI